MYFVRLCHSFAANRSLMTKNCVMYICNRKIDYVNRCWYVDIFCQFLYPVPSQKEYKKMLQCKISNLESNMKEKEVQEFWKRLVELSTVEFDIHN